MKDRKARQKKKHAQKQRQEHCRLQNKQRLEDILSALGLLQGFRELPSAAREAAVKRLPGRPKVVLSPGMKGFPQLEELRGHIVQDLEEAEICTADGRSLPVLDVLSVCRTLPSGFSSLTSTPLSAKQRAFVTHAVEVSRAYLEESLEAALDSLDVHVVVRLVALSRMDELIFGCSMEGAGGLPGKPVCRLVLQASEPRLIRVEIDGQERPAYQCAVPWLLDGIHWMDCDGALFGLDPGRRYPILLQSHALLRLRERLAVSLIAEMSLNTGLTYSLSEPAVVERQGDSYLLDFHFGGSRVGYLVARVAGAQIVIVTFLFLTMEGTPESRLLRQRLRLSRRDIEYEGLDRLETFLAPDILADGELVRVLEESGCGPLLKLARDGFPHTAPTAEPRN